MIEVARLLAGHYEAITVYRFPDGLYEKFKQVVVLAYKRKLYQLPTDKEILSLQSLASTELEPIHPAVEPIYELLPAPFVVQMANQLCSSEWIGNRKRWLKPRRKQEFTKPVIGWI
jgi:hypothetical protein